MSFREKIDSGDFAVLAEITPPKGADTSMMRAHAARAKDNVDAFLVTDMPGAIMRMSSIGMASVLEKDGMDAVLQIGCRNRNRIALQGDLLAASACGISAVAIVEGEDPELGDNHEAQAVYDVNSADLIAAARELTAGRDMAGAEIAGIPDFLIGAYIDADAFGKETDLALQELQRKKEKGAAFFITSPVFDTAAAERLLSRTGALKMPLIANVLLLKSAGMARYISHHQKNVAMPDTLIDRIQKAQDRALECIKSAAELVSTCKTIGFSGVVLTTLGWENRINEILNLASL